MCVRGCVDVRGVMIFGRNVCAWLDDDILKYYGSKCVCVGVCAWVCVRGWVMIFLIVIG